MEISITSPTGTTYRVGKEIGDTSTYRVRKCGDEPNMFKVAKTPEQNGLLDREAYLLRMMRKESDALEKEYAERYPGKLPLNYHFCFPEVIETFVMAEPEQGNRRALVLGFSNIVPSGKLTDLAALSFITRRDKIRVDPRTSAWILGKLLKMLVFTQSQNILTNGLTAENILINRESHYVGLFNWNRAIMGSVLTAEETAGEISRVTKLVQGILGADLKTGTLVPDDQLADLRYEDLLRELAAGTESDAQIAHTRFYKLIKSLWPTGFHKFAGYAL